MTPRLVRALLSRVPDLKAEPLIVYRRSSDGSPSPSPRGWRTIGRVYFRPYRCEPRLNHWYYKVGIVGHGSGGRFGHDFDDRYWAVPPGMHTDIRPGNRRRVLLTLLRACRRCGAP